MQIISKVYKATGKFGPYEIKKVFIKGLALRKRVLVLRSRKSEEKK